MHIWSEFIRSGVLEVLLTFLGRENLWTWCRICVWSQLVSTGLTLNSLRSKFTCLLTRLITLSISQGPKKLEVIHFPLNLQCFFSMVAFRTNFHIRRGNIECWETAELTLCWCQRCLWTVQQKIFTELSTVSRWLIIPLWTTKSANSLLVHVVSVGRCFEVVSSLLSLTSKQINSQNGSRQSSNVRSSYLADSTGTNHLRCEVITHGQHSRLGNKYGFITYRSLRIWLFVLQLLVRPNVFPGKWRKITQSKRFIF